MSIYSLHVPIAFGGKAGFDMNRRYTFPQVVLASVTLVRGGAGDGGARARAMCEPVLPLCSVAIPVLSGVGLDPKLMEQKL